MPAPEPDSLRQPASPGELFLSFTVLAVQGFGGVLALAQNMLVDRRRWLSATEFVDVLSTGQVLPGPNICNVALIIGNRFFGLRGALAALAGLLLVPLGLVLVAALLYEHYRDLPQVADAVRGMGAVAAGMMIGTGLKLLGSLRNNPLGLRYSGLLVLLCFTMVGLLRVPLIWALLVCGSIGITLAWRAIKRSQMQPPIR